MDPGPGPWEHGGRPGPEERAREDARRRDEEFRRFADAMPQLVWIADAKGPISWFNRRWYEYTGLTVERSAGWGWRRARHPSERDVVERFRARVQAGAPWEETISLLGRDGRYRRFLSRAEPVRDDEGRILRWIGTDTDVEDQFLAQEELERFFQVVPDMLCVASMEGRFLRLNPAFVQTLGWSQEELVRLPFVELVHPDDREATRAELAKLARGEATVRFENRYRTRSGGYRLLAWAASPRTDRGFLYATARDITEQRRLADERAEALALLDTLIDTAPVGLAFFDESLRYLRINRILAGINGRPVAEHLGRTLAEVRPDLVPVIEPLLRRVLETGEPVLNFALTDTSPGLGGGTAHRLVGFYPVKDASGRTFGAGVVVADVTELKQAEAALRDAAEFRERFLGIVAHDLRNPLAAITAAAYLLQRMKGQSERGVGLARSIAGSASRMGRMISDVMDFTRVRLGSGMTVEREPADLVALVRQALDELAVAYPRRELRLDAEGSLDGVWDGNRLVQVASNLVKNALDYSPAESAVEVGVRREDGQAVLEVRNRNADGPIPAETLPALFEPFRQAGRAEGRRREGLGLGLYIAREIVRAHGGTIEVASGEEGTTFTVRLPVAPPAGG